jgi:hypothetical protein
VKLRVLERAETLEDDLVTKPELARILRVSSRTCDNWMKAKILPYIKVRRLVRFNVRRCLEALARFEKQEIR